MNKIAYFYAGCHWFTKAWALLALAGLLVHIGHMIYVYTGLGDFNTYVLSATLLILAPCVITFWVPGLGVNYHRQ